MGMQKSKIWELRLAALDSKIARLEEMTDILYWERCMRMPRNCEEYKSAKRRETGHVDKPCLSADETLQLLTKAVSQQPDYGLEEK